jgi:HD-like signal output (HDOD) protein
VTELKDYEISHEHVQKVMSTIDIPACPSMLSDAMREAQKDEPDLNRLAKLIGNDAGMAAAALKLANSPLYAAGSKISSVRKAVERLGTKNIVCVVVAVALRASMTGLPASWLEQFWKRTTTVAIAASLVARRQFGIPPDIAYTYALFHDAAIPMMMRRFPNYAEVLESSLREGRMLVNAEEQYFPCTHPIIGSLLVRNWGLPPMLGQAIRFHHEDDAYDLPEQTLPGAALALIAVTQVAEHLMAEVLESEDIEVGGPLFEHALSYLGLSENDLDDLRQYVLAAIEGSAG